MGAVTQVNYVSTRWPLQYATVGLRDWENILDEEN